MFGCAPVIRTALKQQEKKSCIPDSLCVNFWADSWSLGIFPQHKAIRVERLQVLEVKFRASAVSCGRRSPMFSHFTSSRGCQACVCCCGEAGPHLVFRDHRTSVCAPWHLSYKLSVSSMPRHGRTTTNHLKRTNSRKNLPRRQPAHKTYTPFNKGRPG